METVLVDKKDIDTVITSLLKDQVVAFPTETVFGLAVRFQSKKALQSLYALKHREKSKAITLMVPKISDIYQYGKVTLDIEKVIQQYMPGKITVILEKLDSIEDYYTANKPTIGIRIPDDPFVLSVLHAVGPMWVTSANVSGAPSMTSDVEVLEQFGGKIPIIVKGGSTSKIASTVVDLSGAEVKILREGEISLEMIRRTLHENSISM